MKCKICGGEFIFLEGEWVCQSCGAKFILDAVYENTEVYICYKENDENGRRTKDSIIAQEVYQKLESSNIKTFYERVSADGKSGDDLGNARYSAIIRAKVLIVLGTSVENFAEIENKYSELFASKTVIPFCVDVNPGDIPKTLTRVQAISYSLIGWDKDLVNGLYNLLEKESTLKTNSLYKRRRRNILIVFAVVIVLLLAVFAFTFKDIFVTPDKDNVSSTQIETKPKTQQEIYDEASALFDQEKFIDALILFLQIPDHPDSANKIKLIYSRYEGYYQSDDVMLHLDVQDNTNAELELKINSEDNILTIKLISKINVDSILGEYVDSHNNSGKIELLLRNDEILLNIESDDGTQDKNVIFKLSEKSDLPVLIMTREVLFEWLENEYTLSQIQNLGYDIEFFDNMSTQGPDDGGDNVVYRIKDTNIYLSMIRHLFDSNTGVFSTTDDPVLLGVSAPAEIIAPSMIGEKCLPDSDGSVIYWPNGLLDYSLGWSDFVIDYFEDSDTQVEKNTVIGISLKSSTQGTWSYIEDHVYKVRVEENGKEYLELKPREISSYRIAENNTHYMYKIIYKLSPDSADVSEEQWVWGIIDKNSKETNFITETITYIDYTKYPVPSFSDEKFDTPPKEFAKYFPDLYGSVDNEGSEYIEATTATQDITIPKEPTYSNELSYTVSVDDDYN